ncbi:LytR/AlgR family response regulator transcription factor [Flagellimonas meridianipacifica]|uniref:DNA-binding LytR/AlgR family response regulator n=1 Tax=Flagellimonas meridianipacifica TaxID=1080225 RepID=A0A2T0M9T4_9FLAO|nr:LytTR family DNA-binding domain-containing protein [Allomuricauda pacifica]PRX54271.1 DNA-binding LytR/AlgR family response regulator [Allomuricauda pacifica]
MKCMIIEDEEPAIKVLESHISHFTDLEIHSVHTNTMDALPILQEGKVDILFLDIQLPKISGIEFLKSLSKKPAVILTTAYREYALDGYELEITDYLLKPISFERFAKSLAKAYSFRNSQLGREDATPQLLEGKIEKSSVFSAPFIYIKCEREYVKVLLEELLYVESVKNHIKVVTEKATLLTLMSISQMEEKLPQKHFIRIHRSFIISLHHISKFNHTYINIGSKNIPIGRHYKQAFFKSVEERKF